MTVEEELRAIREELVTVRERLGMPEPRAYRYERTAEMLGVSLSHVKRLVAGGKLIPSHLGSVKVIAASEIERLLSQTTTRESSATRTLRPVATRTSARRKGDGEEIRKALKG
jgi:hypothetical protein